MITVSIAGATPAEVGTQAKLLSALLLGVVATAGTTTTAGAAPGGDAAAKAKAAADKAKADAAAKVKADKAKADAAKAKADAAAGAGTEGEITLVSLRELGRACIKAGKNDQMKATLTELGSDSITTLDASKYAELDAKLREIINPDAGAAPGEDAL